VNGNCKKMMFTDENINSGVEKFTVNQSKAKEQIIVELPSLNKRFDYANYQ
jgi:hypothetical protein